MTGIVKRTLTKVLAEIISVKSINSSEILLDGFYKSYHPSLKKSLL